MAAGNCFRNYEKNSNLGKMLSENKTNIGIGKIL